MEKRKGHKRSQESEKPRLTRNCRLKQILLEAIATAHDLEHANTEHRYRALLAECEPPTSILSRFNDMFEEKEKTTQNRAAAAVLRELDR